MEEVETDTISQDAAETSHSPCPICKDLDYDQKALIFIIKDTWTFIDHTLSEIQKSANNGCFYCSILAQASSKVADGFWKEYDASRVRVKFFSAVFDTASVFLYSIPEGELQELKFELFRVKNKSPLRTGLIGAGDMVAETSASEACFKLIRDWLETCKQTHDICQSDKKTALPTRLLDVSEGKIRLYVPGSRSWFHMSNHEPYLALSHCWGITPILTTTKNTIEDHQRGIEMSTLPKNFQDAVEITRKLGFMYLWIDSLCIVQDDREDWEREAAKMASVYSGAELTIAATASFNGQGGLFRQRGTDSSPTTSWPKVVPLPATHNMCEYLSVKSAAGCAALQAGSFQPFEIVVKDEKGTEQFFFARIPLNHDPWDVTSAEVAADYARATLESLGRFDIPVAQSSPFYFKCYTERWDVPLLGRAWVFQERLLSRRMLHYGPQELVWECRGQMACECGYFPTSELDAMYHGNPTAKKAFQVFRGRDIERDKVYPYIMSRGDAWRQIIRLYTLNSLTFEKDRLPALSGIASYRSNNDKYLAGLWASQLPESLLWISDIMSNRTKRPAEYRAPTWSWASMLGPIRYLPIRGLASANVTAKFVRGNCKPAGLDPRGCVTDGEIVLKAPVIEAEVVEVQNRDEDVSYSTSCAIAPVGNPDKNLQHTFTLDVHVENLMTDPEVCKGQRVSVLLIASSAKRDNDNEPPKGWNVWALVLRPSNRVSVAFERVGIIWPTWGGYPLPYAKFNEPHGMFEHWDIWVKNLGRDVESKII